MSDDDLPQNPLGKSFLESLRLEFPEEFSNKPRTLAQELKNIDAILAVEEDYLDKPDVTKEEVELDYEGD